MKKLKVTVNGKQYDVVVEEIENIESTESKNLNKNEEILKKASDEDNFKPKPENKEKRIEKSQNEEKESEKESENKQNGEAIKSPMPGTIVAVNVQNGKKVSKGEVLVILEAMKMENEIVAPFEGEITSVRVKKGDSVNTGEDLLFLN